MTQPPAGTEPAPLDETLPAASAARRKIVIREGAMSAMASGLTEPYMIPYALAVGATPFDAGLLSSARNVLVALVQLASGAALRRVGSRRRLLSWTVAIHAAFFVPLAVAVPFLGVWSVVTLIACYTLGTTAMALGLPAWGSLLAEGVAGKERGRFFGRRGLVVGLCATAATLVAGVLLALLAARPVLGFALLCTGAALSRLGSWRVLRAIDEPPWHDSPELQFSFRQFLAQLPTSNYARFTVALGAANFATHLAAPLFAVYLLRERGYDYLTYSLVILAGSLAGSLTSAAWGAVGDRTGNRGVIRWGLAGITLMPVLWTVAPSPGWMAAVNALGAILWSGVNVSSIGFLYDAVSPPKRHTCVAYFNVTNGIAVGAGAFLGGWAVLALPAIGGSSYVTLFWTSTVLRLAAAVAFIATVHEVRPATIPHPPLRLLDLVGQRLVAILAPPDDRPH